MFKGENADWQFNHYMLELTNDKLIVKYHEHGKTLSQDTVEITYLERYQNNRLKIVGKSEHHLFQENPTLVRDNWDFLYVFFFLVIENNDERVDGFKVQK